MKPELKKRLTTAFILIGIMLGVIFLASVSCFGRWFLMSLAIIVTGFCSFEFAKLAGKGGGIVIALAYFMLSFSPALYLVSLVWDISVCLSAPFQLMLLSRALTDYGLLLLFPAMGVNFFFGRKNIETAERMSAQGLVGTILIGLGGCSILSLALIQGSSYLVLWLLIVVGCNDSAAYFAGSNIPSPKIIPSISPNKSLVGFAAGLLGGALPGICFGFLFQLAGFGITIAEAFALALVTVVFAQIGDLSKSLIKRMNDAKDSGNILPGHGGVLDRVDGVLAGAIVLNYFILNHF